MQENLKQTAHTGAAVADSNKASRRPSAAEPGRSGVGSAHRRFRLGRSRRRGPLFVEVAEEWLSAQTHLRPRVCGRRRKLWAS